MCDPPPVITPLVRNSAYVRPEIRRLLPHSLHIPYTERHVLEQAVRQASATVRGVHPQEEDLRVVLIAPGNKTNRLYVRNARRAAGHNHGERVVLPAVDDGRPIAILRRIKLAQAVQ